MGFPSIRIQFAALPDIEGKWAFKDHMNRCFFRMPAHSTGHGEGGDAAREKEGSREDACACAPAE